MRARITKEPDFARDSVGRLVLRLALPAVVAQIINLLYNLVDRMYVGSIPGHGTDALAGLGVAFPITLIVSAFSYLVGMGGAPLAGIKMGEGRREDAAKVFNGGTGLLLVMGAVLTAVVLPLSGELVTLFGVPPTGYEYARDYLFVYGTGTVFVMLSLGLNPFISTQGYSVTAMITVAIGAVLNIALDPLFIFVFDMGVKGAALATVISQGVSAIWVTSFFLRRKSVFKFNFRYFIPRERFVYRMLLLGLSPFIMAATESAIQIVFNVNLTRWSGGDSSYTAALTVMLSAVQIISMPLNGLGTGVQPLVSYCYGAGLSERIKKTVKIVTCVALCVSVTVWAVSLGAPQIYGVIFSAEPDVMAVIVRYTPVFMMGTVMFFAQMTLQNVFVALGQARISIFLACLRKVILLIPLCFLLPLAMGVDGVFYSEGIADIAAGVTTALTFFVMFPRILKKREAVLAAERAGSCAEAEKDGASAVS